MYRLFGEQVAGNHDVAVGKPTTKPSGIYTNSVVRPDVKSYLSTLSEHIQLSYSTKLEKFKILLVHGSPRRNNEYLTEKHINVIKSFR